MPSKVDMCNNALQKIGVKAILDLLDDTEQARKCNIRFDSLLDSLLCIAPWTFAMARLQIAANSTAPAFEYSYRHTLPSDCLQVLDDYNDYPYRVEGNYIFSDSSPIKLIYTKRITDMNRLSALFVEMFQDQLAMELAIPLAGSASLRQAMGEDLRVSKKLARSKDAQQGTPKDIADGEWITIRSKGNLSNKVLS